MFLPKALLQFAYIAQAFVTPVRPSPFQYARPYWVLTLGQPTFSFSC